MMEQLRPLAECGFHSQKASPAMPSVKCQNCGLFMQVPEGGRRLCGCGAWLSGDEPVALELAEAEVVPESWPRIEGDLSAIERLNDGYRRIRAEMNKAIVGQGRVLEELLIAIFARGHCLLVGVPGLAKTLMIRTLADALNLSFSRIQFTPDLMPSDITGTEVLQEDKATGQRVFKFLHGPLFSNVILADEVNRTPPKTQAALLEAMQERQVTVGGQRHKLPDPFFVLATQNPIEQEGTYPLPEAQQDRFMFNVLVDYPEEEEEFRIVEMTTTIHQPKIERVLSATDILEMQDIVRKVPVAPYVIRYAMKFTRLTRKEKGEVPDFIREYVTWGAGPRATQYLVLGAKARAVLHGRYYVSCEDIRAVAAPVLRHRIITNFNAEAKGIKPDDIVRRLAEIIPRDPHDGKEQGTRVGMKV
jgi:MoxR-like ATPase